MCLRYEPISLLTYLPTYVKFVLMCYILFAARWHRIESKTQKELTHVDFMGDKTMMFSYIIACFDS